MFLKKLLNFSGYQQARKIIIAAGTSSMSKYNVVFVLGGPGAGKGTQCQNIVKVKLIYSYTNAVNITVSKWPFSVMKNCFVVAGYIYMTCSFHQLGVVGDYFGKGSRMSLTFSVFKSTFVSEISIRMLGKSKGIPLNHFSYYICNFRNLDTRICQQVTCFEKKGVTKIHSTVLLLTVTSKKERLFL